MHGAIPPRPHTSIGVVLRFASYGPLLKASGMECAVIWQKAGKLEQFGHNRRCIDCGVALRHACDWPSHIGAWFLHPRKKFSVYHAFPSPEPPAATVLIRQHVITSPPRQSVGCPSRPHDFERYIRTTIPVLDWGRGVRGNSGQCRMATATRPCNLSTLQNRRSNQVPVLAMSTHVTCSGGQYFSSL